MGDTIAAGWLLVDHPLNGLVIPIAFARSWCSKQDAGIKEMFGLVFL